MSTVAGTEEKKGKEKKPGQQQKQQQGKDKQGASSSGQKQSRGEARGEGRGEGNPKSSASDTASTATAVSSISRASSSSSVATAKHSHSHSHSHSQNHVNDVYRLKLFDQLMPKKQAKPNVDSMEGDSLLHPTTLKLGGLYRHGIIRDDDDRVVALIQAFVNVIDDYTTPSNKSLRDDLDKHIKAQVNYLISCRQHCMGMGNLIKQLRLAIASIPADRSEAEAKLSLKYMLESFLEERILFARQSIIDHCLSMIKDNDVILTFGSSPLIRQVLLAAAKLRNFRLVVVDTRPLKDGLLTLQALSEHLHCIYTPLSGAAAVMRDVTRVILGASALLSNGSMLAPAGTAMIAALAKAQRVPVIIAAESYKFCEKVQLDAIVFNELGSVREIAVMQPPRGIVGEDELLSERAVAASAAAASSSATGASDGTNTPGAGGAANSAVGSAAPQLIPQAVAGYRGTIENNALSLDGPNSAGNLFQIFNLRYDLTPIGNISVVATETGLIPPTSVPVLIRELRTDDTRVD